MRWGDERTYETCCLGVPKGAAIAVGSHGCIKLLQDRGFFVGGLEYAVNVLKPKTIVVYGAASYPCFDKLIDQGIKVVSYPSRTASAFERRRTR